MKTNTYTFTAKGGWDIDASLKPEVDAMGNVIGFELPDGRMVRLAVTLEVDEGDEYIIDEDKMSEIGFFYLDYSKAEFTKVEQE